MLKKPMIFTCCWPELRHYTRLWMTEKQLQREKNKNNTDFILLQFTTYTMNNSKLSILCDPMGNPPLLEWIYALWPSLRRVSSSLFSFVWSKTSALGQQQGITSCSSLALKWNSLVPMEADGEGQRSQWRENGKMLKQIKI